MGRIVEQVVTQTIYRLELTREDVEKRKAREVARDKREMRPGITQHERRFAERLTKCPLCGKPPRFLKIACDTQNGYEYKLLCGPHDHYSFALETGGWYETLSKAGADWNERAARTGLDAEGKDVYRLIWESRKSLTGHQLHALKTRLFSGDTEGAKTDLFNLLEGGAADEHAAGNPAPTP